MGSWLSERTLNFRYEMEDGSIRHVQAKANETKDLPKVYRFEDGSTGEYKGHEPDPVQQKHVVEFEQNGRKAVRIRDQNGNLNHVAKSKLDYYKTGKVDSAAHMTKEYKEKVQEEQMKQMRKAEYERKKRGGHVTPASASEQKVEDKIAQLPDGEYLSDGKNVFPAPKQK